MKKYLFLSLLAAFHCIVSAQSLADTVVSLQGVEVQGVRFAGLSGGEVKRLQTANNLSSVTGTAADAFRQIPSLTTDIEGGVTFRGSNKTGMLWNGVPYGLFEEYSGDVLIQLPAIFLNTISAAPYPSIGQVPDGDAGLLNLSSTFPSENRFVQATLGGGWNERYNGGWTLGWNSGKFHLASNFNRRREYRERSFRKTTTDKTGTAEMNNNAAARPDVYMFDGLIGYDVTPNDLLSAYLLRHQTDYSRYGAIHNTKTNPAGEVVNRMLRNRYNDQRQEAYAAELRWQHRFSDPLDRLDVVFNYNNFLYDEDNDYKNQNPAGATVAQDNLFITQEKDYYYLTAAYQKNFSGNALLKAGYIGQWRDERQTTDAANFNLSQEIWTPNAQKSDAYTFSRTTQLAYASLEKQWENVTGEAGVQGEYSSQQARDTKNDRLYLYPRLRLSYRPNNRDALSLNFIQRVIRPTGTELNDFVNISDATHIIQGNPDLKEEIVSSLDLTYTLNLPAFRLSPALYYRHKANRILETVRQTADDKTIWQKGNTGNSGIAGAELSASWTPLRRLSLGLSGNIFRDEIDGRIAGYDSKKSMVCGDLKGAVNVHITANTEFQADAFYISDQLTPQGKIKSRYTVNAGLSHYLLQRKLRLNLSLNNLFDSLEEVTFIDTPDLQMEQVRNRDARVSWLTLTYQL